MVLITFHRIIGIIEVANTSTEWKYHVLVEFSFLGVGLGRLCFVVIVFIKLSFLEMITILFNIDSPLSHAENNTQRKLRLSVVCPS